MALPNLTAEQRAEALKKAGRSRRERACFLEACKAGSIDPARAIDAPVAQGIPVRRFIESFPGFGRAKAEALMESAGISSTRRVRGLGCRQRAAVLGALEGVA